MKFGDKITFLRKQRDLSQQAVASNIGIHAPVLGKYERNEMKPSIEMAKKIADFYSVSLDYLVSENQHQIRDKNLVNTILEIESLNEEKRKFILTAIDALLRDAKAQQAYSK